MTTKKMKKKILIISDDYRTGYDDMDPFEYVKEGNYYYDDESNYLGFEVDLIETFKDFKSCDGYDAVLIDYGLVGEGAVGGGEEALKKLQQMYVSGTKMAWCCAMAGYVRDDIKKVYPKMRFLHALPCCSIGSDEILWMLYHLFERTDFNEIFIEHIDLYNQNKEMYEHYVPLSDNKLMIITWRNGWSYNVLPFDKRIV